MVKFRLAAARMTSPGRSPFSATLPVIRKLANVSAAFRDITAT